MEQLGLVDISKLDSSIPVSLMYATADNFMGEVLYDGITKAYLHPQAAAKLMDAQKRLKSKCPNCTLKIMDAARPLSVQQKMWDRVKGTPNKDFVSNPASGGGLHNYGLAVDVTLSDIFGCELDMGTPVDFFGAAASILNEEAMVLEGSISKAALKNRQLMRSVMRESGFSTINSEWWHFNMVSRDVARKNYSVIE